MGESLKDNIYSKFEIENKDINTYSPLTLAYIGDGVYDMIIRTAVVGNANRSANDLHHITSKIVKASAQAALIHEIMPDLTGEEVAIYKRGRNAKSKTMAKNATMSDYRNATGLEALMGYLYLTNQMDRAIELVVCGLDRIHLTIGDLNA